MRFVPILFLILMLFAVMLLMPRFFKPAAINTDNASGGGNGSAGTGGTMPGDITDILNKTNETAGNASNTTVDDFKKFIKNLGESERAAVIMDITGAGNGTVDVYDCGARLAWQLAAAGKNVSNYVREGENCTSFVDNETKTRGMDECADEIGTTPTFYIGLSDKNDTAIFEDLAIVLGDRDYICNINVKLTNNTSGG